MASNKTLKLKFIMAVGEYNQYWGKKSQSVETDTKWTQSKIGGQGH